MNYFNTEYNPLLIDEDNEKYYLLSLMYYYKTESYDRKICSNVNGYEEAMPTNEYERKLINLNAKKLYDELLKDLNDIDKLNNYKNYFCRLHFDRLKEEYMLSESKIEDLLDRMKGCD